MPASFLEETSLCGDEAYLADRVAQYREAGVTVLNVEPIAADLTAAQQMISTLKELTA